MIACLCPVYRRPRLTENIVACFLAQQCDMPSKLIVVDDGPSFYSEENDKYVVISQSERFPDLGSKYNFAADLAVKKYDAEILVVWEDDDVYLPWHLQSIVHALKETGAQWAKPSLVFTPSEKGFDTIPFNRVMYNYHAAISLMRKAWEEVKWPTDGKINYDARFMCALEDKFGEAADTLSYNPTPSYVFRFGSTKSYHGQSLCMGNLNDTNWYKIVPTIAKPTPVKKLEPRFDEETTRIFAQYAP